MYCFLLRIQFTPSTQLSHRSHLQMFLDALQNIIYLLTYYTSAAELMNEVELHSASSATVYGETS